MADIEDGFDIRDVGGPRKLDEIQIKIRSKRDPSDIGQMDSFVPGVTPIWVKTWGCSHNASDSEYMAGILAKAGYPIVAKAVDAKLWVLNSCTVKTPSETQASNLLEEGKAQGKHVVMAGCVSQAAPDEPWLKDVSIVGVKQIDRIVEVVEETLKGNTVRLLSRKRPDAGLSLPKMRKNALVEVLAINTGCLNHCTYCKTKMARGDLKSYPLEELVEQARTAFDRDGVKELWLTSEDLGAWGRDIGLVLPDLLSELVKVIPEGCMMRLGMTNPPYILDYLEEIAAVLNHPRVYSFLHIPVQSGSDAVLRDMKREYSNGVHAVGHNKCYEHFLVPYHEGIMGSWVRVRVTEVAKFHMRSELCSSTNPIPTASPELTDWTAKRLENCEPIGTFKSGDGTAIRSAPPGEKSSIAVIVLSVPILVGMILWYFIGI
ncbi:unnamed protein product [Nippostrongylus brasiliensis]|uniref:tRNA-t(6)A37 methylthiotransferase n=1 Tax=Nippostrongylus brasiliensis TaxID=27835 RepID=A0A0N4YM23_NIPBR|nr:unnamed protein product [Nippostrongylus brasiliensis]